MTFLPFPSSALDADDHIHAIFISRGRTGGVTNAGAFFTEESHASMLASGLKQQ